MLNCGRSVLLYLLFVVAIERSAGFWPFDKDTVATPSVKVIPETDGNFIYFKNSDESTVQQHIDAINKFIDAYKKPIHGENLYNCNFENPPPEGTACDFNHKNLDRCTSDVDYGFRRSNPCLLFTLSQVLNWTPAVLSESDIQLKTNNSFSAIPEILNSSITHSGSSIEKYIWFSCEGDTSADKEFIGPVSYYPQNGFPTYYFPYKSVEGYQSPIVAVHFKRPMNGIVITIICKAWAKNIQLDEENGLGYIKVHLLVD